MRLNANKVILVVEDASSTRQLIRQILHGAAFQTVEEATDGPMALDKLTQRGADLIILDWNLPQMSGIAVLRAIRSEPRFHAIPVIMVTGKAEKEAVEEAILAGITDYIVKPFRIATLENKIKKIFGG